jgi:hypothetical protein
MISRQEVMLALRRNLMKRRVEPMFGVEDITDLNNDLHRFLLQEQILARLGQHWPSVLVSPADDDWASLSPERAVPIDFQALAGFRVNADLNLGALDDQIRREFWHAQQQGLPVWTTPLPNARRSFFEGLGDLIYSRARWLGRAAAAATATSPRVTVTSAPANQQARWTKGHFFSVHTVFGNTAHTQNVNTGIYCFWLVKDTPTPLLPLYDIQQDTNVPL